MGATALTAYYVLGGAAGGARASSLTFHGLTFTQLLHAITSRSETRGAIAEFSRPANPTLYGAIAASASLQVAAQLIPGTRRLLSLAPLGLADILGIAAITLGSTLINSAIGYVTGDDVNPAHAGLVRET